MSNSVKITQSNEQIANMDRLINGLLDRVGAKLVDSAKAYAPVDTGDLRDSIEVKGKDYENKVVKVGSSCEYAIYQEFSTSKQNGTPYLRPALDDLTNEGIK